VGEGERDEGFELLRVAADEVRGEVVGEAGGGDGGGFVGGVGGAVGGGGEDLEADAGFVHVFEALRDVLVGIGVGVRGEGAAATNSGEVGEGVHVCAGVVVGVGVDDHRRLLGGGRWGTVADCGGADGPYCRRWGASARKEYLNDQ